MVIEIPPLALSPELCPKIRLCLQSSLQPICRMFSDSFCTKVQVLRTKLDQTPSKSCHSTPLFSVNPVTPAR